MRNHCMVFALFAVTCTAAFAQIPNSGFESWTGDTPDGWATSNAPPVYTNVTKSTTFHSGSAAARGEVVSIGGPVPIQPVLQSGPGGEGFAISYRPASITGWYQFSPVGGDRFAVNVGLFKGGVQGINVAVAASADATPHGSYVQFDVPFQYLTSDIPDTCVIQHQIIGPTTGPTWHQGSWFLVDDLAFSGTNDVRLQEAVPLMYRLAQNYPNPFNPTTTIRYTVGGGVAPSGAFSSGVEGPDGGHVRLVVCDLLGRDVTVLVNERKAPGRYEVRFDASGLSTGVYVYRLISGRYVDSRKMVLIK